MRILELYLAMWAGRLYGFIQDPINLTFVAIVFGVAIANTHAKTLTATAVVIFSAANYYEVRGFTSSPYIYFLTLHVVAGLIAYGIGALARRLYARKFPASEA